MQKLCTQMSTADAASNRLPEETKLKLFIDETMVVGSEKGDLKAECNKLICSHRKINLQFTMTRLS